MSVFQPNAVLGNSRCSTHPGQRRGNYDLFLPPLDFPQNVLEGMPAVYLGARGHGRLTWTFEHDWQTRQYYVPRRNILVTDLLNSRAGLELQITDMVHPRATC